MGGGEHHGTPTTTDVSDSETASVIPAPGEDVGKDLGGETMHGNSAIVDD